MIRKRESPPHADPRALTAETCDDRSRFRRKDAALFIYSRHWRRGGLASLINEDLGLSDHPGDEEICYSLIMSFQMNMFSFWKYYLGKTGCQWPPAGFNELTFRSTSCQPCVVWCPRAAGMKSEDVRGASKICSKLTVNTRETAVLLQLCPRFKPESFELDWLVLTWLVWLEIFLLFLKQKLTSDWIQSILDSP